MSIIKNIVNAIKNIESTIGLKTDRNTDTIFGRLNRLESISGSDVVVHKRVLGHVVISSGTNAILSNPVYFDSIEIEDNAMLTILDEEC